MNLRYAIESLIFFVLLIGFQYEISTFNKALHLSIADIEEFELLKQLIVSKGGNPFDPENPDANKYLLDER